MKNKDKYVTAFKILDFSTEQIAEAKRLTQQAIKEDIVVGFDYNEVVLNPIVFKNGFQIHFPKHPSDYEYQEREKEV